MLIDQPQTNVRHTLHTTHTHKYLPCSHGSNERCYFHLGGTTRPDLLQLQPPCLPWKAQITQLLPFWFSSTSIHDKRARLPTRHRRCGRGAARPEPEPVAGLSFRFPTGANDGWSMFGHDDRSFGRCIFTLWTNSSWEEWGFFL